uniref:Uncharacterized protein n=1 Tax=Rhizophora mucronata TaxID=61149 RepID=A0A2P2N6H0_RHIMU
MSFGKHISKYHNPIYKMPRKQLNHKDSQTY